MFQFVLGFLLVLFGVFLKVTKDPGFSTTKKYWWMFVLIGLLSISAKLLLNYQQGEL